MTAGQSRAPPKPPSLSVAQVAAFQHEEGRVRILVTKPMLTMMMMMMMMMMI